jgi:hypothetical protein
MRFDLTDEESSALRKLLVDAIEFDRYPLSPRVQTLRRILAEFEPIAPHRRPDRRRKTLGEGRAGRDNLVILAQAKEIPAQSVAFV